MEEKERIQRAKGVWLSIVSPPELEGAADVAANAAVLIIAEFVATFVARHKEQLPGYGDAGYDNEYELALHWLITEEMHKQL